jgi:hypothetical protein
MYIRKSGGSSVIVQYHILLAVTDESLNGTYIHPLLGTGPGRSHTVGQLGPNLDGMHCWGEEEVIDEGPLYGWGTLS